MSDRLTALDATFLELEDIDEGALMGIGGVMVFDPLPGGGAPTVDQLRADLAARLERLPRYMQRLSSTHSGSWAWPCWVDDERFDISAHVSGASLPPPGSDPQLCDFSAEFFSHRLDRSRPLWHTVLIEGLEHGRWAIANKTHHCLVDGVGSVNVVGLLLDSEPNPTPAFELELPSGGARPAGLPLPGVTEPLIQASQAGLHAAGAGVHAVLHPRDALERSRSLAQLIAREPAPHSSLNHSIGQARRFAVIRVPLAELKAIGRRLGGSVNDVVLAACAGGLRSLLVDRGEELPERGLRAMVPMNMRDSAADPALGNRVTSLFVDLPVAEEDAAIRVALIAGATSRLKRSGAGAGTSTLMDLVALAPPVVVHAALARSLFSSRMFNLTITNVPGPRRPLYAFGAELREVHPVVPLAADHAVGIAIFSYNGLLTFGINADCSRAPDLDVLAYGIEEAIEELRALAPELATTHDETRS
jgi:diacylglycerol O-acyltransferase / wax synthase